MSDAENGTVDAYEKLRVALASFREELWREYELAQRKVDNSTRFRIIILGWSLTVASLVSVSVGLSKLPAATSVAALAFTALLLVVVHKLATDHVATGLAVGKRAQILERQLQVTRVLSNELRDAPRSEVIRAAGPKSDLKRSARGGKPTPEALLVRRIRKKCNERAPRIAVVATSDRIGLSQFAKICFLALFSFIPPVAKNKNFPKSLVTAQHILWVQLGFVLLGVILAVTRASQPAVDTGASTSTGQATECAAPIGKSHLGENDAGASHGGSTQPDKRSGDAPARPAEEDAAPPNTRSGAPRHTQTGQGTRSSNSKDGAAQEAETAASDHERGHAH